MLCESKRQECCAPRCMYTYTDVIRLQGDTSELSRSRAAFDVAMQAGKNTSDGSRLQSTTAISPLHLLGHEPTGSHGLGSFEAG